MLNEKGLIGTLVAIVVVIVLVVGAAAGSYWWQSREAREERQKIERQIDRLTQSIEDLRKKVVQPVKEVGEKVKETVEGEITITSPRQSIKVTDPQPGEAIGSPVKIAGKAQVFEGNLQLRVKDSKGKILGKGFTTATMGAPEWGEFEEDFEFDQPAKTQVGTVEIFTEDAATGGIDDLVTIPVLLVAE